MTTIPTSAPTSGAANIESLLQQLEIKRELVKETMLAAQVFPILIESDFAEHYGPGLANMLKSGMPCAMRCALNELTRQVDDLLQTQESLSTLLESKPH